MMEMSGQEKEIKTPGSLGFNTIHESSGGERRRDSSYNNNVILGGNHETPDQQRYHLQEQTINRQQQSFGQGRDPDPDIVTGTEAAYGATRGAGLGLKTSLRAAARYMECLKNHAASVGGNVVDGCGEFMQSGEEGTPEALKCAACKCHRSFHRRVADGETWHGPNHRNNMVRPPHLPPPLLQPSPIFLQQQRNSMGLHVNTLTTAAQPMTVAFGGSVGTESSSEDLNALQSNVGAPPPPPPPFASSKQKRFRTKFTQEQKDKMLEFAEKVGWKIQNQDEAEIQNFCAEVGVKRQVFKVWMHNNKNSMKQPQQLQQQQL